MLGLQPPPCVLLTHSWLPNSGATKRKISSSPCAGSLPQSTRRPISLMRRAPSPCNLVWPYETHPPPALRWVATLRCYVEVADHLVASEAAGVTRRPVQRHKRLQIVV
jgi:hypothetical protein